MVLVTDKQFYMAIELKGHLDSICHDVPQDYDFIVCISGDGMTRTGKTTLAQQCAYYCAWKLGYKLDLDNCSEFCFSGKELISKASKTRQHIYIYDEALEDLDSKKSLSAISMGLLHFFAECGKLNHIIFVVLPDFFNLNRGIAITRSEALINVWLEKKEKEIDDGKILIRDRGHFDYFTRNDKRKLWILGKKNFYDYAVQPATFTGHFTNLWIFNKDAYEKRKDEFIQRSRDPVTGEKSPMIIKLLKQRNFLISYLNKTISQNKIAQLMTEAGHPISQRAISGIVNELDGEQEKD